MNVEYLDHSGSDNAIANSARVSFGDFDNWNGIPEGYSKERCEKLIKYLGEHQHTSPFRQNSITVRCKAPIFIARQLMKHQAGLTWNEVSRRYVDSEPEFYMPQEWRSRPEGSLKQGSGTGVVTDLTSDPLLHGVCSLQANYNLLVYDALKLYNSMLDSGVAPEMARMVLPQSMMVEWVWTGNLLAFSHVYNLRIKPNAQLEVQEFAKELDKVIAPLFPIGWKALTEVTDIDSK